MQPKIKIDRTKNNKAVPGKYYYVVEDDTYFYLSATTGCMIWVLLYSLIFLLPNNKGKVFPWFGLVWYVNEIALEVDKNYLPCHP
jgi:hypothetical protein